MTLARRRYRLGKRLAAALIAVVVGTAGCSLPIPGFNTDPVPQSSPEPGWTHCPQEPQAVLGRTPADFTFDCRTVTVPQDWHHPDNGQTLDISLIRARSRNQHDRIGSLLVNPGGPGASGVDLAMYLTGYPIEPVTDRFDLVGFDPRGVSRSSPVDCYSDADLDKTFAADPDPVSQQEFDNVAAITKSMGEQCAKQYGKRLSLFSTEQAARDMDAIRKDLGEEKLTYLGYSYGTLLGAVYAQLFPQRVRAMVLDGAVNPTENSIQSSEGQAMGFERAFDNFAAWCADNASRCPIDGDARAVLTKLMEQAHTNPVGYRDGRQATPGWIFWGVVSSLYTKSRWPDLGKALADLNKGDAEGIFTLADSYADRNTKGEYTNMFDANSAVNCADEAHPATLEQIRELQTQWRQKYPLFGAPLATGLLTCALWPAERDPYPAGAAKGAPPILVVGTKGDPATPYESTAALATMLGTGTVLTWNGEGHTAYPETACITNAVNNYLINLVVPPPGKICPPK